MENHGVATVKKALAPWTCKAQIYSLYFYSRPDSETIKAVSTVAHAPLERDSFFASVEAGQLVGGLGAFMIVRYTDTPVGPYDELVVIPGSYSYHTGNEVERRKMNQNPRVTRIYVSQKDTLYNGRYNWNFPKQMARFDWRDLADDSTEVKVFPYEADESAQSAVATPLFRASFKKIRYTPAFPFSTTWTKYLGLDIAVVQPPLPQGRSSEVVGTERWCKCNITQYSPRTSVCWVDISQRDENGELLGLFENFWPGLGRWHLGVRMDDATIEVPEGEFWTSSTARPRL